MLGHFNTLLTHPNSIKGKLQTIAVHVIPLDVPDLLTTLGLGDADSGHCVVNEHHGHGGSHTGTAARRPGSPLSP